MSYRNPKQIVDTQSGQYIREMQRSLADTYSKYTGSIKQEFEKRAKLNAKIVADSQERVNKASNEINQVANANKAIDFDQMYDNLDTYNKYMQINPAKRTREMNLFISNMDNSGLENRSNAHLEASLVFISPRVFRMRPMNLGRKVCMGVDKFKNIFLGVKVCKLKYLRLPSTKV